MEKTAFKLCYESSEETARYPVIVVAAGSSSRMQGVNKQLALLEGVPVIVRTLKAFDNCPFISRIILVTRSEDIPTMQSLAEQYGISSLTDITEGGENRHESVKNGFLRLAENEDRVLIHDGARPFVDESMIERAYEEVCKSGACVIGMPVKDTIKIADEEGSIAHTPDRRLVWMIQTPQVFRYDVVRKAYDLQMSNENPFITDDAMVVEQMLGMKVRLVEGSYRNIKITTPEDISLAETLSKNNL